MLNTLFRVHVSIAPLLVVALFPVNVEPLMFKTPSHISIAPDVAATLPENSEPLTVTVPPRLSI